MKNDNYINELVKHFEQLSAGADQAEEELRADGASSYSCGIQAGISIAYSVAAIRLADVLEHQRQMHAIKEAFAL